MGMIFVLGCLPTLLCTPLEAQHENAPCMGAFSCWVPFLHPLLPNM